MTTFDYECSVERDDETLTLRVELDITPPYTSRRHTSIKEDMEEDEPGFAEISRVYLVDDAGNESALAGRVSDTLTKKEIEKIETDGFNAWEAGYVSPRDQSRIDRAEEERDGFYDYRYGMRDL